MSRGQKATILTGMLLISIMFVFPPYKAMTI